MLNAKSLFRLGSLGKGNTAVNRVDTVHAQSLFKTVSLWAMSGLGLVVVSLLAVTAVAGANGRHGVDTVTSFRYDPGEERWLKTVTETVLPDNPDGSRPPEHHTIELFLNPNDPVKLIQIEEALVIDPSGNISGPLLEIKGHEPSGGGSGKINIGTLSFTKVDAEELKIDADVVRVIIENTVAEDNELDLDLNVVNVVRTGRGASSRIFLGRGSGDLIRLSASEIIETSGGEKGLRVDRIRIIGPSSGVAFVENIVITRTAVFGKIEVDDVRIQDLVLKGVTVDDNP